ncbi:MAG: anaerobic carbon-monoxide dehydrogenase catalytic subunit [Firmicutes bacterium]|jgi:carbon-monoxide dehydrogenase catalytic subunit|nr:anaerobic carbon-monoxide dehydrogenase catalytic subunit [Bacillota bacterium]
MGANGKGQTNGHGTIDPASLAVLEKYEGQDTLTSYDRYLVQSPQCKFGLTGTCCRICVQGPCRLLEDRPERSRGICGAPVYSVVARNMTRLMAGGASSHSDHGRHLANILLAIADGKVSDYEITDGDKLRDVAQRIGLEVEGKGDKELAREVALAALEDFGRPDETPCQFLVSNITEGRKAKFNHCDVLPSSIDRTIVQMLAQTTMGMDNDPVNLIFAGIKTSLADYTGMHIATDISDIIFGIPEPTVSEANLGVIDPEYVNVATHGHNPTLSEMVVRAARELNDKAKALGAKGINVVGICCTGNELLGREGVYLAANQASQELAIMTGAVDAIIVDIQCIMPSLKPVCDCFHTRLITTNKMAKIPGAIHVDFKEETAFEQACQMVEMALEAYKERDRSKVAVPPHKNKVIAGFSLEALLDLFRAINPDNPIQVLTDAILAGELRGVALFCGCNNLRTPQDRNHLTIFRELVKNDVFVIATGCSAGAMAKAGMMTPEAIEKYAGANLKAFLKRLSEANGVELPLAFHMGSCVDNSRAHDLCTLMAKEMGVDVPKVPFAATAPEDMHEKAIAIGTGAVAMGLPVHVGVMPPIDGSTLVFGLASQIARDVYGGNFIFEPDPEEAAKKLLAALDRRTWKLRVHQMAADKFGTKPAVSW